MNKLIIFLAFGALIAARAHAQILPVKSADPIVNSDARGGEVEIIDGGLEPRFAQGGMGLYLAGKSMHLIVAVKNLGAPKVLRVVRPPAPGLAQPRPEIQLLSEAAGTLKWLSSDSAGRDLFQLDFEGGDDFSLEVLMPASFNGVPNIGNPVPGWFGPVYGLKNVSTEPVRF